MKLWAMPCRATQDEQVIMESSDKMWSTGEGKGKPLQYSFLENPLNSMKRQKDMTLKDVTVTYANGSKLKQHPGVNVSVSESKSPML